MFFDQPEVVAGEGNNRAVSAHVLKHVVGVLLACGLTASCSSTSDFGTQLGLTQITAQDFKTDSESAPVSASAEKTETDAAGKKLAFAGPSTRPDAASEAIVAAENPVIADSKAEPKADGAKASPVVAADSAKAEPDEAKKRGFLSALFGGGSEKESEKETVEAKQEPKPVEVAALTSPQPVAQPKLVEPLKPTIKASTSAYTASALPGVRGSGELFEIVRKSGTGDDSDVDLYEEEGDYKLAYAGGLARLAPHGLLRQREDVDTSCFKPQLVRLLKAIEHRYGKKVLVTSGYRSPAHNRRVRGAKRSAHMTCSAADIQVAGVSRWELAKFARSLPGRGGVGTYCHTSSIHVDVGAVRDWNWRCRR